MNFFTWLNRNAHGLCTMMNNELNIVDRKRESWDAIKASQTAAGVTSTGTVNTQDWRGCLEEDRSMATHTVTPFRLWSGASEAMSNRA